jgi:Uma2 family endonuclease
MTAEDYLRIAERDPRPTELVGGEYVVNPQPRASHGRVQAILIGALRAWEQRVPGQAEVYAPTLVTLTDHDLYGPDVVISEPAPRLTERGWLANLPLICVEIRSPSTWHHDVGRKKSVYEETGVPELWLVDGDAEEVFVFRRSSLGAPGFDVSAELAAGDVLTSPLLPRFELPVADLFQ